MARKLRFQPYLEKPDPQALQPYPWLCDLAQLNKWQVALTHEGNCWLLEFFDGTELLARGRSLRPVPECFRTCAQVVDASLRKSGKLH